MPLTWRVVESPLSDTHFETGLFLFSLSLLFLSVCAASWEGIYSFFTEGLHPDMVREQEARAAAAKRKRKEELRRELDELDS